MNKDSFSVARGCFVGAVLGFLTIFFVSPRLSWLGFLAGIAGGYIFQDVVGFLVGAKRAFMEIVLPKLGETLKELVCPTSIVLFLGGLIGVVIGLNTGFSQEYKGDSVLDLWIPPLCISFFFGLLGMVGTGVSGLAFSHILTLDENFFPKRYYITGGVFISESMEESLNKNGCIGIPPTLTNAGVLYLQGSILFVWFVLAFVFWHLWKLVWKKVCAVARITAEFVSRTFVLVHTKKRLICAVDAPLGMLVTYPLLLLKGAHVYSLTAGEQSLIVFVAAIVATAIGFVNYEFIAKRRLGLQPV